MAETVLIIGTLDTKKKEFATLQAHFTDMQEKLGDAIAEATQCKKELEQIIGEKEAEIEKK